MVHLLNINLFKEIKMAQPAWLNKYLTMKPEVNRIFDDLESFHNFCRFELREFNPAELYKKDAPNYGAFLESKRPRRPWQNRGDRRERTQ
jgi:hypothetical protein